jgi:hypothetical protein
VGHYHARVGGVDATPKMEGGVRAPESGFWARFMGWFRLLVVLLGGLSLLVKVKRGWGLGTWLESLGAVVLFSAAWAAFSALADTPSSGPGGRDAAPGTPGVPEASVPPSPPTSRTPAEAPTGETAPTRAGGPGDREPMPTAPGSSSIRREAKGRPRRGLAICCIPLAAVIGLTALYLASRAALDVYSLRVHGRIVEARIVERRSGEIQYRFRLADDDTEYFRRQLGKQIWSQSGIPVERDTIAVRYAAKDPFSNRPAQEPVPGGDEVFGILFLAAIGAFPFVVFTRLPGDLRAGRARTSDALIVYTAVVVGSGAVGAAIALIAR